MACLHPARGLDSLSFFTCLVPARMYKGTTLALCTPWFTFCGLVVGTVCTLAAWLVSQALRYGTNLGGQDILLWLLPGLAWVLCEMSVSRGLHWDGLADVFDALGSQRRGEEFRQILKDSRLGTFGALAVVAIFACQFLGAAGHVHQGNWSILIVAGGWGRGLSALIFCFARPCTTVHSLGGQFASAGTGKNLVITLVWGVILLAACAWTGTGALKLVVLCLTQALVLWRVLAWTKRQGGYSGDFVGCFIELAQALLLLVTL